MVMVNANYPMSEWVPVWDVEGGNELFYYIFEGGPEAKDGYLNLNDAMPGPGISISDRYCDTFRIKG